MRVAIKPDLLIWARQRAGFATVDALAERFPKLAAWEAGEVQPTLKQLEHFARAMHAPTGFMFLPEPPHEALPIPDFRTHGGRRLERPSPDLLDTLYGCQERQSWYREFALVTRAPELGFVNSATLTTPPERAADAMRRTLGFSLAQRAAARSWEDALRLFINQADAAGVLVMISGIVGSNTHRALDLEEFRGFALVDNRAPLVFVNGADSKAGQMFTLAHELAHLWLGSSALSDAGASPAERHRPEEVWCNAVAAEFLVPLEALRAALIDGEALEAATPRLARHFKVSALVILRRMLDAKALSRDAFKAAWAAEMARLRSAASPSAGGDFYRSTLARVSRRFARAVVESTLEGHTLYRDAFRMLGVGKVATFNTIGREAGVMA